MRNAVITAAFLMITSPALAESEVPDLTGQWVCDPAPILIRGEWTVLTYNIQIKEQRKNLFQGEFRWTLPEEKGVKGERVTKEKSFAGSWTAFGVFDWDGKIVEIVSFKDLQRHRGTLVDANTIRFVHSKIGDDAWVSRSVCRHLP